MAERLLTPEEILTILAATPDHIAAATDAVAPERLRAAPGEAEWSANEVLAPLRACADMWGGSISRIINGDHPTIRAINPLRWITQTDYLDLEFHPSLRTFITQRSELLGQLRPLPPEGWSRSATVTGAGRPLQRTVQTYGNTLARHERPHVRQIEHADGALQEA